jgi:hypothetical protein
VARPARERTSVQDLTARIGGRRVGVPAVLVGLFRDRRFDVVAGCFGIRRNAGRVDCTDAVPRRFGKECGLPDNTVPACSRPVCTEPVSAWFSSRVKPPPSGASSFGYLWPASIRRILSLGFLP